MSAHLRLRIGLHAALVLTFFPDDVRAQVAIHDWTSDVAGDQFGASVAAAGDVDADGYPDVIVGAPESHLFAGKEPGPGRARVYSGASGQLLHEFSGHFLGNRFGSSVAGGADLDGDGHADLVVGADALLLGFADVGAGYATVHSGATGAVLFEFAGMRYGPAVALGGDVDADGTVDLILGAPEAMSKAGAIDLRSGSDGSLIRQLTGKPSKVVDSFLGFPIYAGDQLGECVAAAGDLDVDGFADVLGGTRSAWIFSWGFGNRMYAFSGATGATLHQFKGDGVSDGFGKAVASAGDIDGDSVPDILGGAPFDNLSNGLFGGSVRAYSGADGTLLWFLTGAAAQHGFGSSITGLGDIDGDLRSDFAIASNTKQNQQGDSDGGFRVYSGATGSPFASATFAANSSFGVQVRLESAGDVDQDGTPDLLVGLNRWNKEGGCQVLSLAPAVGQAMASSSFNPGDELSGTITNATDVDVARFTTLGGSTIVLTLDPSSAFTPEVSLHRLKGKKLLKALAVGQPDPITATLAFDLPKSGNYALKVRAVNGTAGDYRFTTSIVLPASAASQTLVATANHKLSGAWSAQATLQALAGTRLDATIVGPPGIIPSVTIHAPTGGKVPESFYSTTIVGTTLTIDKALLLVTGKYVLRVTGGGKNDEFTITLAPSPPPFGSNVEID